MDADEAVAYGDMNGMKSGTVRHSGSEYVTGVAHNERAESARVMLKRVYHGTYHQFDKQHLHRYVAQFAGKHNMRPLETVAQMLHVKASWLDIACSTKN